VTRSEGQGKRVPVKARMIGLSYALSSRPEISSEKGVKNTEDLSPRQTKKERNSRPY